MKKIKDKYMTVYTVSLTEARDGKIWHHMVFGSWLARGNALDVAAEELASMIACDSHVFNTLLADKAHKHLADNVTMDYETLKEMIRDELGGEAFLCISDGSMSFRMDVDENDVESLSGLETWVCVTSGIDLEDHNPEFEDPYPETFLSSEAAIDCALRDIKLNMEGRKGVKNALAKAKAKLEQEGKYSMMVGMLKARRYDIWRAPINLGQGAGKTSRKGG